VHSPLHNVFNALIALRGEPNGTVRHANAGARDRSRAVGLGGVQLGVAMEPGPNGTRASTCSRREIRLNLETEAARQERAGIRRIGTMSRRYSLRLHRGDRHQVGDYKTVPGPGLPAARNAPFSTTLVGLHTPTPSPPVSGRCSTILLRTRPPGCGARPYPKRRWVGEEPPQKARSRAIPWVRKCCREGGSRGARATRTAGRALQGMRPEGKEPAVVQAARDIKKFFHLGGGAGLGGLFSDPGAWRRRAVHHRRRAARPGY
jgi:hypothetical protein